MEATAMEDRTGNADLVFVGAGASATFTLVNLLAKLGDVGHPLRIVMIEQSGEFHAGVAYGRRTGAQALILTSLEEFLPRAQREQFVQWLEANHPEELRSLLERVQVEMPSALQHGTMGVGASSRMHSVRRVGVRDLTERVAPLTVKRRLIGAFLTHVAERAVDAARRDGLAEVEYVQAEVSAIHARSGGGYCLRWSRGAGDTGGIMTRAAVLCLGGPPNRTLADHLDDQSAQLLVENPYQSDFDTTFRQVFAELEAIDTSRRPRIALVGSNASAMEVLYTVWQQSFPTGQAPHVTIVSGTGELPVRMPIDSDAQVTVPSRLLSLSQQDGVSAVEVHRVAAEELVRARMSGLPLRRLVDGVDRGIMICLAAMGHEEVEVFITRFGNELGRLKRRMEREYADAAEDLLAQQRLDLVPGRVVWVRQSGRGYVVHIEDGTHRSAIDIDCVVNCSGQKALGTDSSSTLVNQLLSSGLCQVREQGRGLRVDGNFQAASGLFVMGPMLAGNIVDGKPVWHMEHCGRIIAFSGVLAAEVTRFLQASEQHVEPVCG